MNSNKCFSRTFLSSGKIFFLCSVMLVHLGKPVHAAETLVEADLSSSSEGTSKLLIYPGAVKYPNKLPALIQAFKDYHFEVTIEALRVFRQAIRDYSSTQYPQRPLPLLSGNLSGLQNHRDSVWVNMARYFDYLNIECDVVGLGENPSLEKFLWYGMQTESMGGAMAVMPNAASNSAWIKKEDPRAYARATGLTYALGAYMHIPWCLYDGSEHNRFYGSLEEYQPIFQSIHNHRDYLDGYVAYLWHVVDLPAEYNHAASVKLGGSLRQLFQAGVPTVLDQANDSQAKAHFLGEPHSHRKMGQSISQIIAASPVAMDPFFKDSFEAPILRVSAEASQFPLVIHVLRKLSGETDGRPARGTFRLSGQLLKGAQVSDIQLAAVQWRKTPAAAVNWKQLPDGSLEVEVQDIPAWAMLRVQTKRSIKLPSTARSKLRESMPESEILLMRMIRFDNTWNRPKWVDEALASGTDPLEGYHVNRISWSYDGTSKSIEYAKDHGMKFHGSIGLLHAYMIPSGRDVPEIKYGIPSFPANWNGWIQQINGLPLPVRANWSPPRYSASFASSDYRSLINQQLKNWIDLGVSGIQFDDVPGMINSAWERGGDFSDPMLSRFRDYLISRRFSGITTTTKVSDLWRKLIKQSEQQTDVRFIESPMLGRRLSVSYKKEKYPNWIWIGLPVVPSKNIFTVDYDLRFPEGDYTQLKFLLLDQERTRILSQIIIPKEWEHGQGIDLRGWLRFNIKYDLEKRQAQFSLKGKQKLREVIYFYNDCSEIDAKDVVILLCVDSQRLGMDIKRILIRE